ncbi:MAG: DUF4279 domain-containing protein [Myxococcales bacterium]|nr:DUF4279 domain-containing protein [Myxococcales bacterium]
MIVGSPWPISARSLDPACDIGPTHAHRKGDRKTPTSPSFQQGAWIISTRCEAPASPDKALQRLLARLPDDPAVWSDLATSYDLQLRVAAYFTGWNRGFQLSADTLARIAQMQMTVHFDLYGYGDDEDDAV